MDYFITRYDIDCAADAHCAVLEDSIMYKDHPVTAGSKILENFISPLDATVVTQIEAAQINILGKTKMDEFGAGGLRLDSESGLHGFSSGAVSAVADGVASFALCNDYTGAVSQYAAAQGLCYIHPTYGTVSRYGLIPMVSSMDQIGIVCKTPAEGQHVLSIITGYDPKDGAMFTTAANGAVSEKPGNSQGRQLRIGIPANVLTRVSDAGSRIPDTSLSAVTEFAKNFESIDIELKYTDSYMQVMQILCCAELSNNLTRYDGIKFGYRAEGYRNLRELYTKSRTEAFGKDVKLASLIGSMVLSKENYKRYYDKAMRIRRLIKESLRFDKYDVIILPVCVEPGIRNPEIALHALPMLCGLPAVSVPFQGGGITLIADANCENVLFSALNEYQK